MRRLFPLLALSVLVASACAVETPATETPATESPKPLASQPTQADAASATQKPNIEQALNCKGIAKQGGLLHCRTFPNAKIKVSRDADDFYYEKSGPDGQFLIGFDRDEKRAELQVVAIDSGEVISQPLTLSFEDRDYDISRIDGLPKNMVSEYTEAELARIRAATARKKVGFASRVQDIGFENGFIYPIEDYVKTTNFGAQRILNGVPKRPHYGVDLAAPKGTPIVAPADGIVSMADEDMYFEGSLLLIDHGQGLISYYLHMDDIVVEDGQKVVQGQKIATVGSKGRSTGPHLCWRLKWRNRNLDPELLTQWPQ